MMPLLSLAIWIPIVFGVVVLLLGRNGQDSLARQVALVGAIIGFLVTVPLMTGFDGSTAAMQFVEKHEWLPSLNSSYALGVDGISMWFVPLTAFITILVLLAGWEVISEKVPQYFAAFLILSGLLVDQRDEIVNQFEKCGANLVTASQKGDWISLVMSK